MSEAETKKRDRSYLISELERAGAEFRGKYFRCPFHEDHKPSAGIYMTEAGHWRFKCQSCGASGSVFDVIARNEGKTIEQVLKAHSGGPGPKYGGQKSSTERLAKTFKTIEELKAALPGTEAVYLYTNPDTNKPDMIVLRAQTPSGKTFRQARPCGAGGFEMKGPEKPWPVYNRVRIRAADTVVIVEGEKCVHALHEQGITATTSPGGAGKAGHADWQPLAGKNLILWPDNDKAGRKHMKQVEEILEKLEPAPRISAIEPADLDLLQKEDAADFIEQAKTAGLEIRTELYNVLQGAKPKGIAAGVSDRLEAIISGKLEAVPLPWVTTSSLTKALMPGTVTLICGSPGASKSFMVLQALSKWLESGTRACIFELEEDRDFHLMRAIAQRSGQAEFTDPDWIRANPHEARRIYSENEEFLEKMGRCLWACPDIQLTLEQLAEWVQERAERGYRVICIDPVTAAAQNPKPWIEDNFFLQQIKRTATGYGCSVVLVTHPSKTMSLPDMTSLAGSAAYARFSQTILWLENHRPKSSKVRMACGTDEQQHNRTLHVLKARNSRGHGMSLACEFNSESLTLYEYGLITK